MALLFIDTETYSSEPIANGIGRYTCARDFKVLLVSYAVGDADPQVWDSDDEIPNDLLDALLDPHTRLVAHNASFDQRVLRMSRTVPNNVNLGMPRWLCTSAQAQSHGLPGKLVDLCTVLKVVNKAAGKKLIQLFTKPHKSGRADKTTHPLEWADFKAYALQDIVAMRACFQKLPRWNYPGAEWPHTPSEEYKYWLHQHIINERGVGVDVKFATNAQHMAASNRELLNHSIDAMTNGAVRAATQRDAMLDFIQYTYGVALPDLRKDTVKVYLTTPHIPYGLRDLLEVRQQASQNTAAKYTALLDATNADNRFRYGLQYCGAATTGRDTGQIFQPQNLKRPAMKQDEIDTAIQDIRGGILPKGRLADVLGDCVRGVIVAAPGYKLIASDLASIEARVLAWLAGEQATLDYFADFDAGKIAYDQYVATYAATFNISPASVTSSQRQIGKAMVLGLGYGGGVGAFLTFARTVGIDIDAMAATTQSIADPSGWSTALEKHEWAVENGYAYGLSANAFAACEYLKNKWRKGRPKTVQFWGLLEEALRNSVDAENVVFRAGPHIMVRRQGEWTRIRLPSGRCLSLLSVASQGSKLTYHGFDDDLRVMIENLSVYGGKLSGWVTQATARDLLKVGELTAERHGLPVILAVHDEIVCEVPARSTYGVDALTRAMTAGAAWTKGLPLAASGWEGERYRK